jgi:23S rRNA (uracil1939-C5)-methyltransferase
MAHEWTVIGKIETSFNVGEGELRMRQRREIGTRGKEGPETESPVDLWVDRLAWGGRGVGRHGGKVVFVSKTVPGDHISVTLTRTRSKFSEGRIAAVLERSPDRVEVHCPWFDRCGGCQWLAVGYPRQVREKDAMLRHALRCHLDGAIVESFVAGDPSLGYRHRGDFHGVASLEGLRLGFYEENSHRLVEVSGCLLFDPEFNALVQRVRSRLAGDPAAELLQRLTLAGSEGRKGAQIAHARLHAGAELQDAKALILSLGDVGLEGTLVTSGTSVLASDGDASLRFGVPGPLGEMRLRASVRSFTQAHFAMNRRLVETAAAWLDLGPGERVLDLYSGVGNFTLPLSQACQEVVAVEGSPTACADARANAEAHGAATIRHVDGDAAEETARLVKRGERFDAILLDPPRAGAREVLPFLAKLHPARVLYVSCNLPCLERDLDLMRPLGYRLSRVQGFDCFPQTYGVETLCLLQPS